MRSTALKTSQWLVFGLLLFAPLAFGSVEAWARLVLLVGAALALVLFALHRSRAEVSPAWMREWPVLLAVLFFLLIGVQLLIGKSLYREQTITGWFDVFVYLSCFLVAYFSASDERFRSRLHSIAIWFGFGLAVFAVLQRFSGTREIYWTRATDIEAFFGPYFNRNHFAGLMEMLIPFAFVRAVSRYYEQWRRGVFAFVALVMLFSVAVSGSRGGIICAFAACVFVVVLRGMASQQSKSDLLMYCGLLAALGGGLWFFKVSEVFGRFAQAGKDIPGRFQVTLDSLKIVADYPIFGTGLGTFTSIYPQYRTAASNIFMNAAHNDWVQLAVEMGLLGFGVVLAWAIICVKRGLEGVRMSTPRVRLTYIACMAAFGAMLLNSFVEFNLQMPANALWFCCIAAVMAARSERQVGTPSSSLSRAIRASKPEIILPSRD